MDHDSGAIGFYNGGDEQYVRFGDLPPGTDPLSWNRLRAECIGQRQAFYINGELVVELDDDSVHSGDIGLGAGEGEFGRTEVRFDNLLVSRP
jgi:hypothetical protein